MTWTSLLANKEAQKHKTSKKELDNMRALIARDLADAGIAGLSVAYTLVRAGGGVVVLDDGAIGRGMTGRTTAHLVNALDDRYYDLERFHGDGRPVSRSGGREVGWSGGLAVSRSACDH